MERPSFGFSTDMTIVACKRKVVDYGPPFLFQYLLKRISG
jgi:hypothetical protein